MLRRAPNPNAFIPQKKSTQNRWSVFLDDLQKNYESFRILCRN